ncbi:nucleoside hydrolase [Nosocomiicoccus ampullae]|uniref:Purine nucleosidase n=1 Tax=Nosocomiicoccus ampullae TaxID=489910 RepID=A0A9Q2D0D2_9STAP|nr:nucleoside hydrolase [Nosocomiicoccus ampullae]MBB5176613.1 purine nucleosidase [Nosocomiicoccus ampullae]QYA46804.1 nucleoside hydrolase [Nosocomiicoccus ampullae]
MEKIILDVDTGIDDALAILYAIESKKLDILGITTVNGNVPLDFVTKNTLKILQLADRRDIKVYPGAEEPYLREPEHEYHVHGTDGIGNALDDMEVTMELEDTFAADFIIDTVNKYPGEVTLVMVGPLTNLALAMKKSPGIKHKIKRLVLMGGIVSKAGYGNKLPTSEFNIFADAEAAKVVFHKGLDITMVSLDVTHQTQLNMDHINELEGTKYFDYVKDSTEIYRSYGEKLHGKNECSLHDPLTIGYVLDESYVETVPVYVDVEIQSPLSYGQTIADFRGQLGKEPNMKVCTAVDGERFVKDFIDTLKK